MSNPRNQSKRYLASVSLYDLHVTTKSYNVAELKQLGARDVLFVPNGYDPHTHRPVPLTPEEKVFWGAEVGFVGGFERARYQMMLALAESGVQVTVRGPGWEPYVGRHPNLIIKPGWVLGDDYAKAICATKINLCFLRKANRDLHTTRSIEIPACGGFMLAERTNEHLSLFEEGKEAEFFSDEEELIAKVRYYLTHEHERQRIAAAGRGRCLRSGYSNYERLRGVLEYLYDSRQP
jgi:spore maturation protein CgeB